MIGPDRTLIASQIWPVEDITTFEATFPGGFEPDILVCSLGITDLKTPSFSIFPSVSNGQNITIVMNNQVAKSVKVYDITGREVYSKNANSSDVKFSLNVSSGAYFVKVYTESNSAIKKIIIK